MNLHPLEKNEYQLITVGGDEYAVISDEEEENETVYTTTGKLIGFANRSMGDSARTDLINLWKDDGGQP